MEILGIMACTSFPIDMTELTRTNKILYLQLQIYLFTYNIGHQKSSALHWAAKTDNCTLVTELLAYRAEVNTLVDGCSVLIMTSKYGAPRVLDVLLYQWQLRANEDGDGKSALGRSAEKDSVALAN